MLAKSGPELVKDELPILYQAVASEPDLSSDDHPVNVAEAVFLGWTMLDVNYFRQLNRRLIDLTVDAPNINKVLNYKELVAKHGYLVSTYLAEVFGMRRLRDRSYLFLDSIVMSGRDLFNENRLNSLPDGLVYSLTDDGKMLIHLSLEAKRGQKHFEITSQIKGTVKMLVAHYESNPEFRLRVYSQNHNLASIDVRDIYFAPFGMPHLSLFESIDLDTVNSGLQDKYFHNIVFEASRSKEIKTGWGARIPLTRWQLQNIGIKVAFYLRQQAGELFSHPHKPALSEFLIPPKRSKTNRSYTNSQQECPSAFSS